MDFNINCLSLMSFLLFLGKYSLNVPYNFHFQQFGSKSSLVKSSYESKKARLSLTSTTHIFWTFVWILYMWWDVLHSLQYFAQLYIHEFHWECLGFIHILHNQVQILVWSKKSCLVVCWNFPHTPLSIH